KMNKKTAVKRAHTLLHDTNIFKATDKRIGTYSSGTKQRLSIAQALIHQPKIRISHEPVAARHPVGPREAMTLIENLTEKMTILFSTHILSDADEVCDDLLLLHQGELVESGSMSVLRKKYESSKIEVTFMEDNEQIHNALLSLQTVTNVSKVRQTYHLTVN